MGHQGANRDHRYACFNKGLKPNMNLFHRNLQGERASEKQVPSFVKEESVQTHPQIIHFHQGRQLQQAAGSQFYNIQVVPTVVPHLWSQTGEKCQRKSQVDISFNPSFSDSLLDM